jgi:hypothetical protein
VDELRIGEDLSHEPDTRPTGVLRDEPRLPLVLHDLVDLVAELLANDRGDVLLRQVAEGPSKALKHVAPHSERLVVGRHVSPVLEPRVQEGKVDDPRQQPDATTAREPAVVLRRPGEGLVVGDEIHQRREPTAAGADDEDRVVD